MKVVLAALVGIPANLIIGHRASKHAVVERLLSSKPPGERWAVLDNDAAGGVVLHDGPEGQISVVADGCICCNAVALRVELTRLLGKARPQRLLVLPSSQAHIPEVLKLLSDRWLAPVLDLRATIAVVNAAGGDLMASRDANGEFPFAGANIVALVTSGASESEMALARAQLERMAPRARVVTMLDGVLDRRLLDEAGSAVRPRFTSDQA